MLLIDYCISDYSATNQHTNRLTDWLLEPTKKQGEGGTEEPSDDEIKTRLERWKQLVEGVIRYKVEQVAVSKLIYE